MSQPRYVKKPVEFKTEKPIYITSISRPAKEEDFYDAGVTARDVVVDGDECLEKKDVGVFWCNKTGLIK